MNNYKLFLPRKIYFNLKILNQLSIFEISTINCIIKTHLKEN